MLPLKNMVLACNKKTFNGYWISMGIACECHYRDENAFKSLYRFMTQISTFFFFSFSLSLSLCHNRTHRNNTHQQRRKKTVAKLKNSLTMKSRSFFLPVFALKKCSALTFGRHRIARARLAVWKLKWKYRRHDLAGGMHEPDWYVRHTCGSYYTCSIDASDVRMSRALAKKIRV